LFADGNLSHQRWLWVPFHGFKSPKIYPSILDGFEIGVSVLLDRKIVFWSDGAEQMTGYVRIDVLGHFCAENILLHGNKKAVKCAPDDAPWPPHSINAVPVEAMSFIRH
jgi:hypothetical protein